MSLPPPPPLMVYPNTITVQSQPPPSHRHSAGSYGSVFVVLIVIVVISAVACFLGRLCNRRLQGPKPGPKAKHNPSAHPQAPRPRDREPPEFSFRNKPKERDPELDFRQQKGRGPEIRFGEKRGDIEFGIPAGAKPGRQGGDFKSGDAKPAFYNGKRPGGHGPVAYN